MPLRKGGDFGWCCLWTCRHSRIDSVASVEDLALRVGRPVPARPRQDGTGLALAGWGLVAVCAFLAAVSAWQFTDTRGNPLDDVMRLMRGEPALLAGRDGAPETTASIGGAAGDLDGRSMRVVLAGPAAGTATDLEGLRREVLALKTMVDMLSRTNADLARRMAALEDAKLVTGSVPTAPALATPPPTPAPPARVVGIAPVPATPAVPNQPAAPVAVEATEPVVTRSDFALDLGAKTNLAAVRSQWTTLVRAHAEIIGPLTPLVQMREGTDGKTSTHLIAGPFANAVQAAAACERLKTLGTACETTLFSGQGLALR